MSSGGQRKRLLLVVGALALLLAAPSIWRADAWEPPPPPRPDFDYYEAELAEWIESNCLECHDGGGGALHLGTGEGDLRAKRRADFEALSAFVDPGAPWESRLIRKVLAAADGGDPHVGGSFVQLETEEHDLLLDFCSGRTPRNIPPDPWLGKAELRAQPGESVVIDGRDSFDRDREDMESLVYWWTLVAKPPDSSFQLSDRRASRFEFLPDQMGSYAFELRVGDGKVWSAPRRVLLEVLDQARLRAREPGTITGLDMADPEDLFRLRRLYFDLLGRPPLAAEALGEIRRDPADVVETLLQKSESGIAWYEELCAWYGLLGEFRPTSDEARALALRIPSEMPAPHEVEAVLVRDPAFLRRHGSPRALARVLAERMYERRMDDADVGAMLALTRGEALAEGERWPAAKDVPELLEGVLASRKFRDAAMLRRIGRFLSRGEARRILFRAHQAVEAGGTAWRKFQQGIFDSRAWRQRRGLDLKDDLTFIRSLFVDLLERRPSEREIAGMLHALSQMPQGLAPRAVLAKVMVDSGEALFPLATDIRDGPRWLRDQFLRLLGRPPTASEFKQYAAAFTETTSPEIVILGILTTPEYACR